MLSGGGVKTRKRIQSALQRTSAKRKARLDATRRKAAHATAEAREAKEDAERIAAMFNPDVVGEEQEAAAAEVEVAAELHRLGALHDLPTFSPASLPSAKDAGVRATTFTLLEAIARELRTVVQHANAEAGIHLASEGALRTLETNWHDLGEAWLRPVFDDGSSGAGRADFVMRLPMQAALMDYCLRAHCQVCSDIIVQLGIDGDEHEGDAEEEVVVVDLDAPMRSTGEYIGDTAMLRGGARGNKRTSIRASARTRTPSVRMKAALDSEGSPAPAPASAPAPAPRSIPAKAIRKSRQASKKAARVCKVCGKEGHLTSRSKDCTGPRTKSGKKDKVEIVYSSDPHPEPDPHRDTQVSSVSIQPIGAVLEPFLKAVEARFVSSTQHAQDLAVVDGQVDASVLVWQGVEALHAAALANSEASLQPQRIDSPSLGVQGFWSFVETSVHSLMGALTIGTIPEQVQDWIDTLVSNGWLRSNVFTIWLKDNWFGTERLTDVLKDHPHVKYLFTSRSGGLAWWVQGTCMLMAMDMALTLREGRITQNMRGPLVALAGRWIGTAASGAAAATLLPMSASLPMFASLLLTGAASVAAKLSVEVASVLMSSLRSPPKLVSPQHVSQLARFPPWLAHYALPDTIAWRAWNVRGLAVPLCLPEAVGTGPTPPAVTPTFAACAALPSGGEGQEEGGVAAMAVRLNALAANSARILLLPDAIFQILGESDQAAMRGVFGELLHPVLGPSRAEALATTFEARGSVLGHLLATLLRMHATTLRAALEAPTVFRASTEIRVRPTGSATTITSTTTDAVAVVPLIQRLLQKLGAGESVTWATMDTDASWEAMRTIHTLMAAEQLEMRGWVDVWARLTEVARGESSRHMHAVAPRGPMRWLPQAIWSRLPGGAHSRMDPRIVGTRLQALINTLPTASLRRALGKSRQDSLPPLDGTSASAQERGSILLGWLFHRSKLQQLQIMFVRKLRESTLVDLAEVEAEDTALRRTAWVLREGLPNVRIQRATFALRNAVLACGDSLFRTLETLSKDNFALVGWLGAGHQANSISVQMAMAMFCDAVALVVQLAGFLSTNSFYIGGMVLPHAADQASGIAHIAARLATEDDIELASSGGNIHMSLPHVMEFACKLLTTTARMLADGKRHGASASTILHKVDTLPLPGDRPGNVFQMLPTVHHELMNCRGWSDLWRLQLHVPQQAQNIVQAAQITQETQGGGGTLQGFIESAMVTIPHVTRSLFHRVESIAKSDFTKIQPPQSSVLAVFWASTAMNGVLGNALGALSALGLVSTLALGKEGIRAGTPHLLFALTSISRPLSIMLGASHGAVAILKAVATEVDISKLTSTVGSTLAQEPLRQRMANTLAWTSTVPMSSMFAVHATLDFAAKTIRDLRRKQAQYARVASIREEAHSMADVVHAPIIRASPGYVQYDVRPVQVDPDVRKAMTPITEPINKLRMAPLTTWKRLDTGTGAGAGAGAGSGSDIALRMLQNDSMGEVFCIPTLNPQSNGAHSTFSACWNQEGTRATSA